MKILSYITAILLTANLAVAQSISDQELQDRFNKAFSVFNQQSAEAEQDLSKMSEEKTNPKVIEKPISLEDESQTNIVKKSNSEVITSEQKGPVTQTLAIPKVRINNQLNASNFILLKERPVLVDMQNANLKQIVQEALNQVTHGERWTIRWRLKDENKYLLKERINLTAEVSFDSFIGNMLETITNTSGIRLTTKVFNQNRIIIITDSF
ncbi:MAG TPA: hypothetical protein DCL21_06180 [Alphaproteobacteria bacterium]|nr:hypothetical protein [Alphaproteobacteria bacterium]